MKQVREFYYALHRHLRVRQARSIFNTATQGLNVELDAPRIGFFAQMSQLLVVLQHAQTTNQPVRVRLISDNYSDTDRAQEWLSYYFRWISEKPTESETIHIRHYQELGLGDISITLADANALFSRHLALRDEILEEVNAFSRNNGLDAQTLAIHYRGTDKSLEAPRVTHRAAIDTIREFLQARPNFKSLFIGSDEAEFIAQCRLAFADMRIVSYREARPIQGNAPIHFGKRSAGNYFIGKDALMIALLLSRCGAIVRTTSFLSAWASVFNPTLDVTLLNRPYPAKIWFPETAILETARVVSPEATLGGKMLG